MKYKDFAAKWFGTNNKFFKNNTSVSVSISDNGTAFFRITHPSAEHVGKVVVPLNEFGTIAGGLLTSIDEQFTNYVKDTCV